MTLAYLAAPFSHPDPSVKKWRLQTVNQYVCKLLKEGQMVYSPLTHNAPLIELGMQNSWDTWRELDHLMLSKCELLIVLTLEGWDASIGVASEIEFAKANNIPIAYREVASEACSALRDTTAGHL
jgi:hypothetical protein